LKNSAVGLDEFPYDAENPIHELRHVVVMNLYRHYKDKPYRFLNIVRHSETLEDMVLYETLYENSAAKYWVRPKEMFFETIEHNGVKQPRFAKVLCQVENYSVFTDQNRAWIREVAEQCFDVWDQDAFEDRAKKFHVFHISLAFIDEKPVAFKIGYGMTDEVFYSWLGAVQPTMQRTGIASMLMKNQHEWCLAQSFLRIQTKCLNFNQAMLVLNLKHGFMVQDTEVTEQGLKLVLEKRLVEPAY
jgi:hypothetical protein